MHTGWECVKLSKMILVSAKYVFFDIFKMNSDTPAAGYVKVLPLLHGVGMKGS